MLIDLGCKVFLWSQYFLYIQRNIHQIWKMMLYPSQWRINYCSEIKFFLYRSFHQYLLSIFFSNQTLDYIALSMAFQKWHHIELSELLSIQCSSCIYIWIILHFVIVILSFKFVRLAIPFIHSRLSSTSNLTS